MLKKQPSKVAQKTALTAQTPQTEEFMFQNVAYRPTVYRTGATASVFHTGDNLNSDHCLHFPSIGHGNILHGSISFDLNSVQDCPRPFDFWTIFLVLIFLGKMSSPWTMSMQVSEHTDQSLH